MEFTKEQIQYLCENLINRLKLVDARLDLSFDPCPDIEALRNEVSRLVGIIQNLPLKEEKKKPLTVIGDTLESLD